MYLAHLQSRYILINYLQIGWDNILGYNIKQHKTLCDLVRISVGVQCV